MTQDTSDPVRTYLEAAFPGARIELVDDSSTRLAGTRFYAVTDDPDLADLEVAIEFLEDRTPDQVASELARREVANHLRAHSGRVVLLREDGFFLR
jgi:hypothetical protein